MIDQDDKEQKELEGLRAFYKYMMDLYGQNLGVSNWHQNGDIEPLDNFLDSADALVPTDHS